jgi:hypothetical protein
VVEVVFRITDGRGPFKNISGKAVYGNRGGRSLFRGTEAAEAVARNRVSEPVFLNRGSKGLPTV